MYLLQLISKIKLKQFISFNKRKKNKLKETVFYNNKYKLN